MAGAAGDGKAGEMCASRIDDGSSVDVLWTNEANRKCGAGTAGAAEEWDGEKTCIAVGASSCVAASMCMPAGGAALSCGDEAFEKRREALCTVATGPVVAGLRRDGPRGALEIVRMRCDASELRSAARTAVAAESRSLAANFDADLDAGIGSSRSSFSFAADATAVSSV
jgi:hypothetical protein